MISDDLGIILDHMRRFGAVLINFVVIWSHLGVIFGNQESFWVIFRSIWVIFRSIWVTSR